MAELHILKIDLVALRSHLSFIKGRIAGEADAREYIARTGCLPMADGWIAPEASISRLDKSWIITDTPDREPVGSGV